MCRLITLFSVVLIICIAFLGCEKKSEVQQEKKQTETKIDIPDDNNIVTKSNKVYYSVEILKTTPSSLTISYLKAPDTTSRMLKNIKFKNMTEYYQKEYGYDKSEEDKYISNRNTSKSNVVATKLEAYENNDSSRISQDEADFCKAIGGNIGSEKIRDW